MTPAVLTADGWSASLARLPAGLDLNASARDHGALRRRRGRGLTSCTLRHPDGGRFRPRRRSTRLMRAARRRSPTCRSWSRPSAGGLALTRLCDRLRHDVRNLAEPPRRRSCQLAAAHRLLS